MHSVEVNVSGRKYKIAIKEGLFEELPGIFFTDYSNKKIAILCDEKVFDLYGRYLAERLVALGQKVCTVVFNEGEEHKTITTLNKIYEALAKEQFTRSDIVVALGGGVTGDMAGLAAATFLRGTGFIQVPTTLLAMVDSSIGGKVAVDMPQGKNLVGAFYQPLAVYTDPSLLKTLGDRQFYNGMAELVKHGFLFNEDLIARIECDFDRASLTRNLSAYIAESCECKRRVVELDEKDEGPRQLLNFGHTLGHAIEMASDFVGILHGEAISIGMSTFTHMSEELGWSEKGSAKRVDSVLKMLQLPTSLSGLDPKKVWSAICMDKKVRSGNITIITLDRIGDSRLRQMPLDALKEVLYGHLCC